MRKHAIVGSRQIPSVQDVGLRVNHLFGVWGKDWILVSGGADGVCHAAEQTGLEFGLPVISFRIAERRPSLLAEPYFVVEEWRLYRGTGEVREHEPTAADFQSATVFKAMLIAERADSADAFHHAESRGTAWEIECFANEQVPCEVFKS